MHIVGQEAVMDAKVSPEKPGKYVHHFVLYGHYDDDTCQSRGRSMVVGWAPGVAAAPFATDVAGFPMAPSDWTLKTSAERQGEPTPTCEKGGALYNACVTASSPATPCYQTTMNGGKDNKFCSKDTGKFVGQFAAICKSTAGAGGCGVCFPDSPCKDYGYTGSAFRSFTINVSI